MEEEKVLSQRVGKSPAWSYFTKYNSGGECIECGVFLKCINSTSSMLTHLRGTHPHLWNEISHLYPLRAVAKSSPKSKFPRSPVPPGTPATRGRPPMNPVKREWEEDSFNEPESGAASSSHIVVGRIMTPAKKARVVVTKSHQGRSDPLIDMIVVDELPLNIAQLPGFRRFLEEIAPSVELPSQIGLRLLMDQKYGEMMVVVKGLFEVIPAYGLSISEWSDAVNGRNFIGITCNFIDNLESELKSATIALEEVYEYTTEEDIVQKIDVVLSEWGLSKANATAVTIMGNIPYLAAACTTLFGPSKILYCFAQSLNAIAKKPFEALPEVHLLIDTIKSITDFLKQGEEILVDDTDEGQEFWELIYSTSSTWRSIFQMMERFVKFSKKLEFILQSHEDAPPVVLPEVLAEIKDVVKVYKPLKGVCDDISLEEYLSASKVIPLIQCLIASLSDTWPKTPAGVATKDLIMSEINFSHAAIEENDICAMATLLDPRFKKNYFKNNAARDAAIEKLKEMIIVSVDETKEEEDGDDGGIWKFHSKFVGDQAAIIHPITVYLSTKVSDLRTTDPIKYMSLNHTDFAPAAERLFVSQASAIPAKKIFSETGCALNPNWTSLPVTDLRKLMFLASVIISGV